LAEILIGCERVRTAMLRVEPRTSEAPRRADRARCAIVAKRETFRFCGWQKRSVELFSLLGLGLLVSSKHQI
jgi:hypothetical protein